MEHQMRIDIFSDPVCPWCYVGKRRLEQALASYHRPIEDLRIIWRAFQLNPDMPEAGIDRQTYLNNKFGGETRARQIYQNIKQVGASVGIDFQFDAIKTTPNTLKAHRLLRWAQDKNLEQAERLMDNMFKAYFLLGQDIGDQGVLLHCCGPRCRAWPDQRPGEGHQSSRHRRPVGRETGGRPFRPARN